MIDDQPLLFFHFHGLRRLTKRLWQLGLSAYRARARPPLKRLYRHYIDVVTGWERAHRQLGIEPAPGSIRPPSFWSWLRIPLALFGGDVMLQRSARRAS